MAPIYVVQEIALFQYKNLNLYIPGLPSMEKHVTEVTRVSDYQPVKFEILQNLTRDKVTLKNESDKLKSEIARLNEQLNITNNQITLLEIQEHVSSTNR
jgi:hypothetical protein